MSILSVENLSLKIGSESILNNISFKLGQGRILAITGESGSGKSMTALVWPTLTMAEMTSSFAVTPPPAYFGG